ncbi:MAG: lecithin retinol acyltransferase family protein [Filifactor alocis]|nr:lecithin retinol acyltransferase family protein [Filifactor alocis]
MLDDKDLQGLILSDGPFDPGELRDPKEVRNSRRKTRNFIEEKAGELNSDLGKAIGMVNRLCETLENAEDALENLDIKEMIFPGKSLEESDLELADHLLVYGLGYSHHGIYVGDGQVIHYALADWSVFEGLDSLYVCIQKDSLEEFSRGKRLHRRTEEESPLKYSKQEAVSRARERLGEMSYNLAFNNCEHFVRWCRNGGEDY